MSDERYPWALGSFATERGPLATRDYALMEGDKVLAVVERKTFEGLLADFGRMDILRQRFLELVGFEQHAVVIEAPYAVIWTGWLGRPATRCSWAPSQGTGRICPISLRMRPA